ncbi:MAG: hypothetical protein AAF668_17305 [Pseudomonadota bacterium]
MPTIRIFNEVLVLIRSALPTLLFAALLAFVSTHAFAQNDACDSDYVSQTDAIVTVSPSAGDDTENIQCAFDEATARSLKEVRLTAGDFTVSSQIFVESFEGSFAGQTTATTVIRVEERSVACGIDATEGIFEFSRGNVSVRRMSIEVGRPCATGDIYSVIFFTADPADCELRTAFGNVDRVSLTGPGKTIDFGVAIQMAESELCPIDLRLLGTLKVNRSEIIGFPTGVITALVGGAQVDINFNEFAGNDTAVIFINSNTNATITGNVFRYNDAQGSIAGTSAAVSLLTGSPVAPAQNRLVIHNNQFIDGGVFEIAAAIDGFLVSGANRTAHSLVVSSNLFTLSSVRAVGIVYTDVDNGVIVDNGFRGSAEFAVILDSFNFSQPITGWSVVANRFNSVGSAFDVFFGPGTSNSIVGPQIATVAGPSFASSGNFYLHTDPSQAASSNSLNEPVVLPFVNAALAQAKIGLRDYHYEQYARLYQKSKD